MSTPSSKLNLPSGSKEQGMGQLLGSVGAPTQPQVLPTGNQPPPQLSSVEEIDSLLNDAAEIPLEAYRQAEEEARAQLKAGQQPNVSKEAQELLSAVEDKPTQQKQTPTQADGPDVNQLLKDSGLDVDDAGEEPKPEEEDGDEIELSDHEQNLPEGPRNSLVAARKHVQKLEKQLKEKEEAIKLTTDEVEKFKKGELVPEQVKDRLAALEKYERIFALKTSPYYKEKFVAPLENIKTDLIKLATDYQVDPKVLEHAVRIENKRDLNNFLREHFDDLGSVEARDLVTKTQGMLREMKEVEKDPENAAKQLQTEMAQIETQRANQRVEQLKTVSESGWVSALNDLRQNGNYPELEVREGDERHNAISTKIIDVAAKEYGKVVTALAQLGVKELPPALAKSLAKSYQIAYAAPVMALSRAHHYEEAEKTKKTMKENNKYFSPPIGGSAPNFGPKTQNAKPADLATDIDNLMKKTGLM